MFDNILLFLAIATRCIAALITWYCVGAGAVITYRSAKRYMLRRFPNVLSW